MRHIILSRKCQTGHKKRTQQIASNHLSDIEFKDFMKLKIMLKNHFNF